MSNFQIILGKNKSIGSAFLRLVMWTRFSHSALLDVEAGVVYDTTLWQGGCKKHKLEDFLKHYPKHEFRDCPVSANNVEAARQWLEDQLGKGYDFTALVGFLFQRNWSKPNRWFCSEQTETFRSMFSTPRFSLSAWRITPHHQFIIAK